VDPTTTLHRIRELVKQAHADEGIDDAHEFVDLIEALDEWLSQGGFPPTSWTHQLLSTPPLGVLTGNDHILIRAGKDLDIPVDLPYSMCLSLHLYPEIPIFVRVHRRERRAVVQFGFVRAEAAVFVTADQVDRLATLFAHVRDLLR
jgi:hypothetical protein